MLGGNQAFGNVLDVLDAASGEVLRSVRGQNGSFSPEGPLVATTAGIGSGVVLWDSMTGQRLRTFDSYQGAGGVSFSPDGLVFVSELYDGTVALWDIRDLIVGLRVASTAQSRELRWERGRLQEADTVNGPWRDRWDASSPLPLSGAAAHRFYRVVLW